MISIYNGTCQACGRIQAVRANGGLAKHGYTVDYGYFAGTCSGSDKAPLEIETAHNIEVVAAIRDWADKQEQLSNGNIETVVISVRDKDAANPWAHKDISVNREEFLSRANEEFEDLYNRRFDKKVENARYDLRRNAKFARKDADNLEELRSKTHGNELTPREVEKTLHREDYTTEGYRVAYARQAELAEQGIKATVRRSKWNEIRLTYRK